MSSSLRVLQLPTLLSRSPSERTVIVSMAVLIMFWNTLSPILDRLDGYVTKSALLPLAETVLSGSSVV